MGAAPTRSLSLEDLLRPQRKVLATLMRSEALARGDVTAALEQMTEVASEILAVGRVSVWVFDADRTGLECLQLFERKENRHSRGEKLVSSATPRYFASLAEERSIAASDARSDPRTREFTDGYLVPLHIFSMLDAPILLRGEMVGVVCHESIDVPRKWQPWEELLAATFADFVAMALGAAERAAQAMELEKHRAHLEQLVEDRTRELREKEASFRQLFDAAPVAMVLTRPGQATVVAGNARAARLFGLDEAKLEGTPTPDFWGSVADRQALLAKLQVCRSVDHFEAQMKDSSGRTFWADLAGQQLIYEGSPALLFGVHDVSAQKELEARLVNLATTDALTGVMNRRRVLELAAEELRRCDRYGHPMALAMIDADHFKQINDRHGHLLGDQVLCFLASTMQRELRVVDTLGRYGGEEFLVVLPETRLEGARAVMERAREAVGASEWRTEQGVLRPSVSIGVVERAQGEDLDAALHRADQALYAAKEAGRNRVSAPPMSLHKRG